MTEIIVAGFPKSGNTWLTRLLSDALDLPVIGVGEAIPLAADYQVRRGDGFIRQLHLTPGCDGDRFVANCYTLNVNHYDSQKVIHIMRDPRDVAVSIEQYWRVGNLYRVIREIMADGKFPLWGCGWPKWMNLWHSTELPHLETRYCWLHDDTALEIRRLCDLMGLKIVKPLDEVIRRNTIDVKREALRDTDDQARYLPHGKGAQLANLRAGRIGDWRQAFGPEEKSAAFDLFGDWLIKLGYESNHDWLH